MSDQANHRFSDQILKLMTEGFSWTDAVKATCRSSAGLMSIISHLKRMRLIVWVGKPVLYELTTKGRAKGHMLIEESASDRDTGRDA